MGLFNKDKESEEQEKYYGKYFIVKKDPAVVELFDMLFTLVNRDALTWVYKDYSLYGKIAGEEDLHIFYNENNFMPNKSYVRINGIIYSCDAYEQEITRLGLEIKLSRKRQRDNKNEEKLLKTKEILRNKLKETP